MATTNTTLSIPAGMEIDISVVNDVHTGQGLFPVDASKTIRLNGIEREHFGGFVSENEAAGTVELVTDGGGIKVKYKHIKNDENRIHYFSASGDHSIISIISIPIHDHSSVYQGGPAYGTYYFDETETPTPPAT